ncbi:MFS transporter [Thermoactinospora rubra]|uniref:MFS transporter n=1 Tax=Thermoactinospora rubra TaxID=1088767 RepID=UPI000A0FAE74|nr:MFS transporter [Thermoactinospora rubra]
MLLPSGAGLRPFYFIWIGQTASTLGGGVAWFAVTLWAWQSTGSATALSTLLLVNFLPGLLLAPFIGAHVDRVSPKALMLWCDGLLAAIALTLVALYSTGQLSLWHLYVVGAVEGIVETAHWLAYSKVVLLLAGEEGLSRANGLIGLADSLSTVLAPLAGGVLLSAFGLSGVLLVDAASYLIGLASLAVTAIPRTGREPREDSRRSPISVSLAGARTGLGFIVARPALRALLVVFFMMNFVVTMGSVLTVPLIMMRSGDDAALLGLVTSLGGVGGVLGGLSASFVLHRTRRIPLILLGMITGCLLGPFATSLGWSAPVWLAASFCAGFVLPVINGAYQSVWQSAVPLDLQARVFGVRRTVAQLAVPFAMAVAGPLTDHVSVLMDDGFLAETFGTGDAGAAGVLLGACAVVGALVAAASMLSPSVRGADRHLEPTAREGMTVT